MDNGALIVLQRIKWLSAMEVSLAPDYISRVDSLLYQSSLIHFGTWQMALRSAGIDYEKEWRVTQYPRLVQ